MATAVDIRIHGARSTPALEACIRYWAETVTDRRHSLERCTVTIRSEPPVPPRRRSYRVSLQLDLPDGRGYLLIESPRPSQDGVFAAVRDAFRRARAALEHHTSGGDSTRPVAA